MQYLEEHAVMQDLQIYLSFYYTEEYTKAFYTAFSINPEKMLQPYYLFRAKTGRELPPFLLPFFYKLEERYSVISLLLQYGDSPPSDLETTTQALSDIPSLQESMLRHYFQGQGYVPDRTDIEEGRISPLARSLELPEDMKVYLCYCLEHMDIASQTLTEIFRYYYPLIKELHREYAPVRKSMERDLRNGNLQLLEKIYGRPLPPDKFKWFMSVMSPPVIFGSAQRMTFCLGTDYTESINSKFTCREVCINSFLDRFSDKDRRRIFNVIKEQPRHTGELAGIVGLPWDIVQKYLDQFLTENTLHILENNIHFYYGIYPPYFSALAERYREFARGLEALQPAKTAAEESVLYLPEKVEPGEYLPEVSILFSALAYIILYFADKETLQSFCSTPEKQEEELENFYRLRAMAARELPAFLKPLFYSRRGMRYFLLNIIISRPDPENVTLESVLTLIKDTDSLAQRLLGHYFSAAAALPTLQDVRAGRLPDFMTGLELPEDIKIYLIYCLEHMPLVQETLERELRFLYPLAAQMHKEQQPVIEQMRQQLSDPEQLRLLAAADSNIVEKIPEIRYWAVSFIDVNMYMIQGFAYFYLFGTHKLKNLTAPCIHKMTVGSYLDVATDPSLRKIIDYMAGRQKSTRPDWQPVLGCTTSALERYRNVLLYEGIIYSAERTKSYYYFNLSIPYFYELAEKLDALAEESAAREKVWEKENAAGSEPANA